MKVVVDKFKLDNSNQTAASSQVGSNDENDGGDDFSGNLLEEALI
ncbi:MAG: hypothetical protein R2741_07435 [Methanolobus sp.]